MNMDIKELVDNFEIFEDWEDRYRYIIDLGAMVPEMQACFKTDQTMVRGCVSQVWLVLGWDAQEKLSILADSDSVIVKGLVAVLTIIFSGKTKDEIRAIDMEAIFKTIGLDQHLSPNRRNGFFSMVEKIKLFTAQETGAG